MMTIEEMKERKKELMYTCAIISERSGLPLSTVQKVFSGATSKPHFATMEALEKVLKKPVFEYAEIVMDEPSEVREGAFEYAAVPDRPTERAQKVDFWIGAEPTERWPKQGKYTAADYYAVPDDIQIELIDGVIYDMGSPSRDHQLMLSYLHFEFYRCIEEHASPCQIYFAPLGVKLDRDEKTVIQPDLFVICDHGESEDRHFEDNRHFAGAPDLAVEVLSPSTRSKDCTIKLRKYMNAGVREYWIVDLKSGRVLVYMFEEDVLPKQYSFDETVPIGISGGSCSIDYSKIKDKLKRDESLLR